MNSKRVKSNSVFISVPRRFVSCKCYFTVLTREAGNEGEKAGSAKETAGVGRGFESN